MEWLIKTLDEMNAEEITKIYQERVAVFVVEQNCAYQEVDELDKKSIHIWYEENQKIVAYARVIPYENHLSFGRVLVTEDFREQGFGRKLVATVISYIKNNYATNQIEISGQAYLEKFYQSFGFESVSDVYLEDDIPHIAMTLVWEE